jgi:hypothetical protein
VPSRRQSFEEWRHGPHGAELGAMELLRDRSARNVQRRYFRALRKSETDEAELDQSCNLPSLMTDFRNCLFVGKYSRRA